MKCPLLQRNNLQKKVKDKRFRMCSFLPEIVVVYHFTSFQLKTFYSMHQVPQGSPKECLSRNPEENRILLEY